MKKKSKVVIAVFAIVLFASLVLAICSKTSSKAEPPAIPQAESISYISITDSEMPQKSILIKDKDDIEIIVSTITNGSKKTKKNSVNDQPVNCAKYYTFSFCSDDDSDSSQSFFYLYTKHGRHYIESPYLGIWRISGKNYKNCISFYK